MTFFGTNSWCTNASLINLFDEIQKPFLEIYTRMLERKEKNQIRKEKLMAVGLLLSVKVFCLNEITIRITTETKSCSTDPYCLYHKTLRNRTELF